MAIFPLLPHLRRPLSSFLSQRLRRLPAPAAVARSFTTTEGSRPTIAHKRSVDILHDPWFHKTERDRLDLRALLPPNVITLQQQIDRFRYGKIGRFNQRNNTIGLGNLLSDAQVISDGMLELDSHLAAYMKEKEVLEGIIYPPISRSITVAVSFVMGVHRACKVEGLHACLLAYDRMQGFQGGVILISYFQHKPIA